MLSIVARLAGIGRQAIYNEFGSRKGLAQGYVLCLADCLVDNVHAVLDPNVGSIYESFLQGFRSFFYESAADPLVISLLNGVAEPDLWQLNHYVTASLSSLARWLGWRWRSLRPGWPVAMKTLASWRVLSTGCR